MNLIHELTWRGMVQDIMPGTAEILEKEKITGYIGFDPTADSLHIGSLVPIMLLVHLYNAGHKPVVLVGGATGMVGDPSGKSDERNLLDEATLQNNLKGIAAQLSKYISFDANNAQAAVLVNNYDWFKEFNFLSFIRDVGKHITVNYMMSKDSVRKRLEGDNGMSFTEFSYQLVQGYDFYYLHKHYNCTLQMGGSDQWGNILTGAELIRKKSGGTAYAFTCPLITKADGGKFGKSEKGNIWLAADRTSPYEFYQFWIRCATEDAEKWIKIFTLMPQHEIEALIALNALKPEDKLLQKKLAAEVTSFVHGAAALEQAIATTAKLYNDAQRPITELSATELEQLAGIVHIQVPLTQLLAVDIITLLSELNIFPSKSEAKKMLLNGGISSNAVKISSLTHSLTHQDLLHGKYIIIQKGKKHHYLLIVQ